MKRDRKEKRESGTLIVIGGHEDHQGERLILKEIVSSMVGDKLVLATIASHEPDGYMEKYEASFAALGVGQITELYVDDRAEALSQDKLALLKDVRSVFFSGGDQLRITSQIGDTPLYQAILDIYETGGLIAGTSAGASAMGEIMLISGEGASSRIGDSHIGAGLGMIRNVIIDQHFAERGRIGRLIGAVSQNPRMLGVGIDEDTAIVFRNEEFHVIGNGAVYVVDASGVTISNVAEALPNEVFSVHDLKVHVLSTGDSFDFRNRRPHRLSEGSR